jgi:hypothetical protein
LLSTMTMVLDLHCLWSLVSVIGEVLMEEDSIPNNMRTIPLCIRLDLVDLN